MTAHSNVYCVSSLAAIREVNNMGNKMTKSTAENTLANLVAKGWLYKSPYGSLVLFSMPFLFLLHLGADVTPSLLDPSLS